MTEIKLKEIMGVLISVIILTSGATIYLQETGKYTNCKGGWILREDGKYDCPTRDIEPQWCHHGSDEGPENIGYRCYLGEPVDVIEPETPEHLPVIINTLNKPMFKCGDAYCTTADGKTCFLYGNLNLPRNC